MIDTEREYEYEANLRDIEELVFQATLGVVVVGQCDKLIK